MSEQLEERDPLCCCEYIDKSSQRFHILGCCCNCIDFDNICESIICCKRPEQNRLEAMLLTFQDRIRIPWYGGAKRISFDAIIPLVAIPVVIGIAALNLYCTIIMMISVPIFLGYAYYYLRRFAPKTKFFFMWTIWSVIYLIFLFESTVPLLELLPEENYTLIIVVCISLYLLIKTRQKAQNTSLSSPQSYGITDKNLAGNELDNESTVVLIENEGKTDGEIESDAHSNVCQSCKMYSSSRSFHCPICQVCVTRQDHHNFWLDCCVGQENHRYYMMALVFSFLALLLGANLTLTSVCHPFLVFRIFTIPVLLPDDCSDAFDQYEMALSFIVSIYSLMIAVCVFITIILQSYLISRGLTLSEWRRGQKGNRKSVCGNWKSFLCLVN